MKTSAPMRAAIWVGFGVLFWVIDRVLVVLLEPPSLATVALRNSVLLGLLFAIWVWQRRRATNEGRGLCAAAFLISLWLSGAILDVVFQTQSDSYSLSEILGSLAMFPLTTLGVATMSGILPALIAGSVFAVALLLRPANSPSG